MYLVFDNSVYESIVCHFFQFYYIITFEYVVFPLGIATKHNVSHTDKAIIVFQKGTIQPLYMGGAPPDLACVPLAIGTTTNCSALSFTLITSSGDMMKSNGRQEREWT